jgi:hypothetical protein
MLSFIRPGLPSGSVVERIESTMSVSRALAKGAIVPNAMYVALSFVRNS